MRSGAGHQLPFTLGSIREKIVLRTFEDNQLAQEIGHYIRRARQERELATAASSASVADAHLERAKRYEALIKNVGPATSGHPGVADDETFNFTMSSHKVYPFHVRGGVPLWTSMAV